MTSAPGDVSATMRRAPYSAIVLGLFLLGAGVTHFTNPDFFNAIVPPWLPPNESFWTYASGVVEIAVAAMVLWQPWRRRGGLAAIALFIGVYPANLYMTWDWRDRPWSEQTVAYLRLPLQFVLIWWAWRVAVRNAEHPTAPGDID